MVRVCFLFFWICISFVMNMAWLRRMQILDCKRRIKLNQQPEILKICCTATLCRQNKYNLRTWSERSKPHFIQTRNKNAKEWKINNEQETLEGCLKYVIKMNGNEQHKLDNACTIWRAEQNKGPSNIITAKEDDNLIGKKDRDWRDLDSLLLLR